MRKQGRPPKQTARPRGPWNSSFASHKKTQKETQSPPAVLIKRDENLTHKVVDILRDTSMIYR